MKNKFVQIALVEILWAAIIALVIYALLFPIFNLGQYKFLWINVLYIAIAILYSRWVVFFNDLVYLKNKWFKIFIFLINFQIFIFTISQLQEIIPLWEAQSLQKYIFHIHKDLSLESSVAYLGYIKNLVLLSGIACSIATLFLNIRILSSFFVSNSLRKKAMLNDL